MIQEKALLLKDFCARLPYKVIVNIEYSKKHGSSYRLRVCSEGILKLNTELLGLFIQDEIYLKPYLRPMSSMTEEEKKELQLAFNIKASVIGEYGISSNEAWWVKDRKEPIGFETVPYKSFYDVIDWLNAHHFDYRGLIEKGLAIEAPEEMYNIKEK